MLKGLDFIRTAAILILVWGHCAQADFFPAFQLYTLPLPACCLTILFVLSGFLAGCKSDSIAKEPGKYYIKRAKRILPAYYIYLALVIISYTAIGKQDEVFTPTLWYYAVPAGIIPFCSSTGILPLVHLWFITAIVVFYIIAPHIFRISKKHTVAVCLSAAYILLIAKYLAYPIGGGTKPVLYRLLSASQLHNILFGAAIGILYKQGNNFVLKLGRNKMLTALSWLLIITSGIYAEHIPAPLRTEFFAIFTAIIILNSVSTKTGEHLENKLWKYLGKLSYNIYIVHILIILLLSYLVTNCGLISTTSTIGTQTGIAISSGVYLIVTITSILLSNLMERLIKK